MSVRTAVITTLGLTLLATPLAAHKVETGTGDWTGIPLLARHHTVRLSEQAMAGVDALVQAGKCDAIGTKRRINLEMDFLVEFSPDKVVKRVIVQKIGCPEVEQIAATATSQAASKGWLKPTGENDAGWYRGLITYELR